MYSISKYMNGHSDVVMGAAVTNCAKLYKELVDMQKGLEIIIYAESKLN